MTKPTDIASAVKPLKLKAVLTPGQLRSVKRLAAAKAAEKAAKAKVEKYTVEVAYALGDAEIGVTPDGLNAVKVVHSKNTRYDRQVLTTRFPEAAAASYVETPYSFLQVV